MFVLVHKNKVSVGPIAWNSAMFSYKLRQLKVNHDIPVTAPAILPIVIDNETVIKQAQINTPIFDKKTQYLEGPHWELSGSVAVGNYIVKEQTIADIQGNLKKVVAETRYFKENAGTMVTIQNLNLRVNTDRNTRANLALTLASMSENDSVNWKFGSSWLEISKSDLKIMIDAVNAHVQSVFDWEKMKADQIDSKTTIADLSAFEVLTDGEKTPFQRLLARNN